MCENVFDDSSDLQRHTENKHPSSYECLQFEYISMCKEDLDDHIMMNHVEKSLESTFSIHLCTIWMGVPEREKLGKSSILN